MKIKKIFASSKTVTLVWVLGLVVVWEIGAFVIAGTKRTPENILPHLYQIIASVFSTKKVTATQTALQVVLLNAGITLGRAGIGFLFGALVGYVLALLMRRFAIALFSRYRNFFKRKRNGFCFGVCGGFETRI